MKHLLKRKITAWPNYMHNLPNHTQEKELSFVYINHPEIYTNRTAGIARERIASS